MPEKPIEKLTAKECETRIAAARARLAEVKARMAEIRPPSELPAGAVPPGTPGVGLGGRDFGSPLDRAGPEYRRVALEGTPAEMVALQRELDELDAEETQLILRIEALERRLEIARAEEHRAGAPARLKARRKEIDALLDRYEKAAAELEASRAALAEWRNAVLEDRRLIGDDSPFLDPAQLRRLGLALRAVRISTEWTVESFGRPPRRVPALFESYELGLRAMDLLGAPEAGAFDRIRRIFSGSSPVVDQEARVTLNRYRLELLADGKLEGLDNVGEALARELPREAARMARA